jgi:hypothetical protein
MDAVGSQKISTDNINAAFFRSPRGLSVKHAANKIIGRPKNLRNALWDVVEVTRNQGFLIMELSSVIEVYVLMISIG